MDKCSLITDGEEYIHVNVYSPVAGELSTGEVENLPLLYTDEEIGDWVLIDRDRSIALLEKGYIDAEATMDVVVADAIAIVHGAESQIIIEESGLNCDSYTVLDALSAFDAITKFVLSLSDAIVIVGNIESVFSVLSGEAEICVVMIIVKSDKSCIFMDEER